MDYYQTVFSSRPGSVEMPSAGRAFSWELLFKFQLKDIQPDELVVSIRKMMDGENQLHPKATSHLLTNLSNRNIQQEELTKRELDVLKEIAKGKSNKEIAASLFITEKTVKTYVSNLLAKLRLADRTQAALYAVKHHIAD